MYYKTTSNGYIYSIGIGGIGIQITEAEYNEILTALASKPSPTENTDYMLKEDLSWEAYPVEPVDPDPTEEDYAEAGRILMGVES